MQGPDSRVESADTNSVDGVVVGVVWFDGGFGGGGFLISVVLSSSAISSSLSPLMNSMVAWSLSSQDGSKEGSVIFVVLLSLVG